MGIQLNVVEGVGAGKTFPLSGQPVKLGRASQCDIAIPDPSLSRSHCCFEFRDGELWVMDLASANQTVVNGEAVDEKALKIGDEIVVGDTKIVVGSTDGAAVPAPAAEESLNKEPSTAEEVVIDLGFGKSDAAEENAEDAKKSILRPIIWAIGAILILVIGVMLISNMGKGQKPQAPRVTPLAEDKTLLLNYELVQGDAASIFRYEMAITPDGTLSVKIDDVGPAQKQADGKMANGDRHVSKEKKLDQAALIDLIREIESSGFFALDPSYSGFAARENELEQRTLLIVLGKQVHTCQVSNRTEPDAFKKLRERLETFSKNELGIWAIQFSTDKLTAMAREKLEIARKKYDEMEVRYSNLFEALRAYQEAVFYLDTVNPKPDFYNEILDGVEKAEDELEKRYKDQRFQADKAINLSEWDKAREALMILCEMIPDRTDKRYREASQKMRDVESRLKKR